MNIELWTCKFAGKNKNSFTFWKKVRADFIPSSRSFFIYTFPSGNSIRFKIERIEYQSKFGVVIPQLCLKKVIED